jgi:hypothetical protein
MGAHPLQTRAPGWWTEAHLRSVLGQTAVQDDLRGPEPAPGPGSQSWTCHFTLARGRGGLRGTVVRLGDGTRAPAVQGVRLDGQLSDADAIALCLASDDGGGVVHRLEAVSGRYLCRIELEVSAAWLAEGGATTDATYALLELFRSMRF